MLSTIGIITSQYIFDTLFLQLDFGKTFGFQLIPETKIIMEVYPNFDHQPFANNYFSFSIGFGATFVVCITMYIIFVACGARCSRF